MSLSTLMIRHATPSIICDAATLTPCEECEQPTTGRFCAFCRARAQVLGRKLGETSTEQEIASELSDNPLPSASSSTTKES